MIRIPLHERDDSKWEKESDDLRMEAAKQNAIQDISEWLLAGMLGLDVTDEEFIPLENLMFNRLRDSTTRQDLVHLLLNMLTDEAAKLAQHKLNVIRSDQSYLKQYGKVPF